MFARVINFKIKSGTAHEISKRAEQKAVPWLRGQEGFHGMHLLKVSDAEMVAFEVWENKATADASRKEVEKHIQQIIGDLLAAPPTFTEGEQVVHSAAHEPHRGPGIHTPK